jgi:Tol biopolymer transport system component
VIVALLSALLVAAAAPQGPPIEPVPFGLFAPSDMSWTFGASFTPDGRTVYFTKSEPGLAGMTIFVSRLVFGIWSTPNVATFSGQYADGDPVVTPDGGAVMFSSRRPPLGSPASAALYEAFTSGPRAGTVVPLPNSANALGSETSPSIAKDGSVYFTLNAGGVRRIYRSAIAGTTRAQATPVTLPGDVDGAVDRDVAVDPQQRFILFSSIRGASPGSFALYIAFRSGDHWCAPLALPPPINSSSSQIAPSLSDDGNTLYFASNRSDLVQPADTALDASAFAAALARYQDGSMRVYSASVGPWIKRFMGGVAC